MHPAIGGGVSTDFKSLNTIKISRLVQILLHFYWFGAPTPGWGVGRVGIWGLEMMWRSSRQCGDDRDHMGMMWGTWDDVGTTGTTGTTWGGDHGDHRPQGPHEDLLRAMGMMWGWQGWHGDDVGMTGMTWGQHGDHGDNKITKNAITFEWIKIIEFRLKIWDPWTLPHTCSLQLMCRWGGVLSQMAFLSKKCSGDPRKRFFPVFALDPIRPYLDWALRGFLTSWPIYDPLKSQPKWKQSAKFDYNVNFHTQPLTIEQFWIHP